MAGFHIHLSQWHCAIDAIDFVTPLAREIDEKLGWSFGKDLYNLRKKTREDWDRYTSNLERLEAAIKEKGLEANHQQLGYLRNCTLKDTEVSDELLKLMTQIFEIQESARLRGYKLKALKQGELDGSDWWILTGFILGRGVGIEGGERGETYFERLESSWAQIFNCQFRFDMRLVSMDRCSRSQWTTTFGDRLARRTTLERHAVEEWLNRYGGREFGADITSEIEYGYDLNTWR